MSRGSKCKLLPASENDVPGTNSEFRRQRRRGIKIGCKNRSKCVCCAATGHQSAHRARPGKFDTYLAKVTQSGVSGLVCACKKCLEVPAKTPAHNSPNSPRHYRNATPLRIVRGHTPQTTKLVNQ